MQLFSKLRWVLQWRKRLGEFQVKDVGSLKDRADLTLYGL